MESTVKTHKMYRLHPDLVFREEEDGAFLFNPETDTLRCINGVGAVICRFCDGRSDLRQIYRAIAEEFQVDVPEETLESDVLGFIDQMIGLDLLQECT